MRRRIAEKGALALGLFVGYVVVAGAVLHSWAYERKLKNEEDTSVTFDKTDNYPARSVEKDGKVKPLDPDEPQPPIWLGSDHANESGDLPPFNYPPDRRY